MARSNPPILVRGALLNYDFYTNHTEHSGGQASLWHELRYFDDRGSLSSTGYVRKNLSGGSGQQEGYVRYDTTLMITDEEDATTWTAGDVISDALSWSSSVRMGGISYGRDFSLRPDLVTWPLPEFSGEAAVPTSVDLFVNGYRAGSTRLQPGYLHPHPIYLTYGAGDAVLVTTDALGRQVSTTMPFYVTSDLLRQGLSDGAMTLGSLRRNYGIENLTTARRRAAAALARLARRSQRSTHKAALGPMVSDAMSRMRSSSTNPMRIGRFPLFWWLFLSNQYSTLYSREASGRQAPAVSCRAFVVY